MVRIKHHDKSGRRAARFAAVVTAIGFGGKQRLSACTGLHRERIADLTTGAASWEDDKTADIEDAMGVSRGWMDRRDRVNPPPFPIKSRRDLVAWLDQDREAAPTPAPGEVDWIRPADVMAYLSGKAVKSRKLTRDTTLIPDRRLIAVSCGEDCPAPLSPGDLAIFAMGCEPVPGLVVLAYVPVHGTVIRRYQLRSGRGGRPGAFDLASTSSDFPTFTVKGPEDGQIIGSLVQFRRNFDVGN